MKQKSSINDYITKADLDESLTQFGKEIKKEIKEEIVSELEETILGVRDTLLEAMDPVIREVEESREDRVLAAHQHNRLSKRVDVLEKRVTKLEK